MCMMIKYSITINCGIISSLLCMVFTIVHHLNAILNPFNYSQWTICSMSSENTIQFEFSIQSESYFDCVFLNSIETNIQMTRNVLMLFLKVVKKKKRSIEHWAHHYSMVSVKCVWIDLTKGKKNTQTDDSCQ